MTGADRDLAGADKYTHTRSLVERKNKAMAEQTVSLD
jgi:hypothetical protein